jgi:hypothetical protein
MWCFWVTMKLIEEYGTTNVMEFRRFGRTMTRSDCDQALDLDYAEFRDLGWIVSWTAIEGGLLDEIMEMNSHAIWS